MLFLSHHDPERSDVEVDEIVAAAREIFPVTEAATEATRCQFPDCGG